MTVVSMISNVVVSFSIDCVVEVVNTVFVVGAKVVVSSITAVVNGRSPSKIPSSGPLDVRGEDLTGSVVQTPSEQWRGYLVDVFWNRGSSPSPDEMISSEMSSMPWGVCRMSSSSDLVSSATDTCPVGTDCVTTGVMWGNSDSDSSSSNEVIKSSSWFVKAIQCFVILAGEPVVRTVLAWKVESTGDSLEYLPEGDNILNLPSLLDFEVSKAVGSNPGVDTSSASIVFSADMILMVVPNGLLLTYFSDTVVVPSSFVSSSEGLLGFASSSSDINLVVATATPSDDFVQDSPCGCTGGCSGWEDRGGVGWYLSVEWSRLVDSSFSLSMEEISGALGMVPDRILSPLRPFLSTPLLEVSHAMVEILVEDITVESWTLLDAIDWDWMASEGVG